MTFMNDFSLYEYLTTSAKYKTQGKVKLKEFEKGEYI